MQVKTAKDHILHQKKGKTNLATCFCCKKKYKAGKYQHPKYSLCSVCKRNKKNDGKGELWVDCDLLVPWYNSSKRH